MLNIIDLTFTIMCDVVCVRACVPGRYRNVDRAKILCTLCNSSVIENEYHFMADFWSEI